jgi:hypothetical protein
MHVNLLAYGMTNLDESCTKGMLIIPLMEIREVSFRS